MDAEAVDRPGDPKAARSKEAQLLRERGPLAAEFEDTVHAIEQLHAALHANESDTNHKALRILADRCLGRLTEWGQDSGASSRLLDHRLRRASQPRDTTLHLLKELHELILKGARLVGAPPSRRSLTGSAQRSPPPSAARATSR